MWRGKTLLNVVLKLVGILVALQEIAFFEQMRAVMTVMSLTYAMVSFKFCDTP